MGFRHFRALRDTLFSQNALFPHGFQYIFVLLSTGFGDPGSRFAGFAIGGGDTTSAIGVPTASLGKIVFPGLLVCGVGKLVVGVLYNAADRH